MPIEQLPDYELTQKIIGLAMKVHNHFGNGFLEKVYQKAMEVELKKLGIKTESEVVRGIHYEGVYISNRRMDMIVNGKVLIEFKAVPFMDRKWEFTVINYLKVFEIEVGLLLNFGCSSLTFRRFYNPTMFGKHRIP